MRPEVAEALNLACTRYSVQKASPPTGMFRSKAG